MGEIAEDSTILMLDNVEEVLFAKGWTKPNRKKSGGSPLREKEKLVGSHLVEGKTEEGQLLFRRVQYQSVPGIKVARIR